MKKNLLLLSLLMMSNIITAQLYISEILVSPPGNDSPREFIELRGTPDAVIPDGTYLVQIEGDIESGEPGDVESNSTSSSTGTPQGGIIDLSGLSLGSNGFLVILTNGHPYANILDPDATVITDVTDGTLEDKSHTFLLINTDTPPTTSDDIDSDNDGVPDGAVYNNWTILDGISMLDDDNGDGGPEYAYADVVFVDQVTLDNGNVLAPPTATIVGTPTEYDYFSRVGNSTGFNLSNDENSDWMGGNLSSVSDLTVENWQTSSTPENSYPNAYADYVIDHLGSENTVPFAEPIDLYINEIMVSPPGSDSPNEFIELRGMPGATIPEGTYMVQIEGDEESGEPGDVESNSTSSSTGTPQGGVIDLGGITLGPNGFLVILTNGHPYDNILNPDATVITGVTDGTLEDKSHTFLLINAPVEPSTNDDIDSDNDGVPDGAVYDSWTILDGISMLDDDNGAGEFEHAYSDVVFVDQVTLDNGAVKAPPTATIIGTPNEFDYFARVGNSTGSTVSNDATSDWMGGDLSTTDLSVDNWVTSSTPENNFPEAYAGYVVDHLGSENPIPPSLSVEQVDISNNITIYPNPADAILNIKVENNLKLDRLEIYSILGSKVLSTDKLDSNQLNVSDLNSGMYILRVISGSEAFTKKIIIQ